jgi:hypothetical protein
LAAIDSNIEASSVGEFNMDVGLKIITRLPLEELWRNDLSVIGSRQRGLTSDEIGQLLREGTVEFVVADVGHVLRWINIEERYEFWKNEVKPHLAAGGSQIVLDDFPGSYCYIASHWGFAETGALIILLERHH